MGLADLTDKEWFARLNDRRLKQAENAAAWWPYYENSQPLHYVARILREQEDAFPPLLIDWAELVTDALEERLDVEWFRLGDDEAASDDLERVWQANDLDEESGQAHLAALVTGESYVMVGPGDDVPLVTVETAEEVAVEIDPRTRQVVAALKIWRDDWVRPTEEHAVLYLPGRMVEFEKGQPFHSESLGWYESAVIEQRSSLVPIFPMFNRRRRGRANGERGRSDLVALKPIVDGANQTATNMMAAIEHHAVGRKWALNVDPGDFEDENGKKIPAWKAAMGAVWALPPFRQTRPGEQVPQPSVGQFNASDLRNFHDSLKQLAQISASLYGLPPHFMGFTSENPASADAIRAAESRLIKRAERRQRTFGGTWEQAMRAAWAMLGNDPKTAVALETVWRDPATPTKASMIDAAVKAVGGPLIDVEQGREDAGYTRGQQQRMAERDAQRRQRVTSDVRSIDMQGVPSAASILGSDGGAAAPGRTAGTANGSAAAAG
ncbi:phage portal protein [Saccharopolyspora sp. 6T]|uniref:phage portal protein n=1 Tax=Saccharopolyspora sp. 6T TaxID=2877238 RepID=UPI001CD36712|nr:phage portal protein [Saccharopolyspora sp. 6T]MCA1185716.1 phage portal protein [Saccharopolyspora sp. 6T]